MTIDKQQRVTGRWHDTSLAPAVRARALLDAMTLEEKVSQLGSSWPGEEDAGRNVAPMQDSFQGALPFEQEIAGGLGHITRPFGTAPIAPEDGRERLAQLQRDVVAANRFGIPAIVHEECLTGFTAYGATVYPAAIAWGATFDPELVERMAAAIGRDMAALGVHQGLSPVLDVVRDYRWGRVEETIGEDPYLVADARHGLRPRPADAGVIATLKHFAGYSASRGARNHGPVSMGRRELPTSSCPPFETAIALGGARSVMNSYSDVDGVPAGADAWLLTELLRDEWGFAGTVVSDYWAVPFLATMHRVAADLADAGALALDAGHRRRAAGHPRLRRPARWTGSARRGERRGAGRPGGPAGADPEGRARPARPGLDAARARCTRADVDLDSPRNRDLAREMAERPSSCSTPAPRCRCRCRRRATVAVVGPCADDAGCRSWAATPSPTTCCRATPAPGSASRCRRSSTPCAPSCPAARSRRHEPGAPCHRRRPLRLRRPRWPRPPAPTCASRSSATWPGCSATARPARAATSRTCDLPGVQAELLEALLDAGNRVVVVVVSGRPYALGALRGPGRGLVQAFMPGEEGGAAIAGVLSGRVSPSGRLPVQIPGAAAPSRAPTSPRRWRSRVRHQQPRPDPAVPVRPRPVLHHVRGRRGPRRRGGRTRRRADPPVRDLATPATGRVPPCRRCTCPTWSPR